MKEQHTTLVIITDYARPEDHGLKNLIRELVLRIVNQTVNITVQP
jgi:hypothetical protein